MSKHTPGPWTVENLAEYSLEKHATVSVMAGPAVYLADVRAGEHGRVNKERALADARLIAAAPDMLEALKEISEKRGLTMLGDCCIYETCKPVFEDGEQVAACALQWGVLRGFNECAGIALAAIAKATGAAK